MSFSRHSVSVTRLGRQPIPDLLRIRAVRPNRRERFEPSSETVKAIDQALLALSFSVPPHVKRASNAAC